MEFTKDGDAGWLGNAVVNVPLGDKSPSALRDSTAMTPASSIADRPGRRKNINDSKSYGGRVSLLVEPVDNLRSALTATGPEHPRRRTIILRCRSGELRSGQRNHRRGQRRLDAIFDHRSIQQTSIIGFTPARSTYDFGSGQPDVRDQLQHSRSDRQLVDATLQPTRNTIDAFYNCSVPPLAPPVWRSTQTSRRRSSPRKFGWPRLSLTRLNGSSVAITPTRRAHCSRTSFPLTSPANPKSTTGWT